MKRLILIASLMLGINAYAQDFGSYHFSWSTNGMSGVKEYRVYSTFGGITNKFELLAVTTNNFVVVSNQVHIRRVMYVTALGKNGRESLPSCVVSFPKENPESSKLFDYEWVPTFNTWVDHTEQFVSPVTPVNKR